MVVRIMVMVPLYAVASLISLFSLEAAFFIDAVRDIYEVCSIIHFPDLLRMGSVSVHYCACQSLTLCLVDRRLSSIASSTS